jgi:hypothetical protein
VRAAVAVSVTLSALPFAHAISAAALDRSMAGGVGLTAGAVFGLPELAKLLVGAELCLCLGWAVVVRAAVMAHVQPLLQRVAERRLADGTDPPRPPKNG